VSSTDCPGLYKVTLTNTECDADIGTLHGNSSTTGVMIVPVTIQFERLPDATPGEVNGVALLGSAMALSTSERTAVANEVETQLIDETDSEKVLKAITDKIAAVNPSLSGLTLAAIASQVRTELATELARIDAAISSRLAAAGYTSPDNSGIAAAAAAAAHASGILDEGVTATLNPQALRDAMTLAPSPGTPAAGSIDALIAGVEIGGGGSGTVVVAPVSVTVQREPVSPRDLFAYTDGPRTHQLTIVDSQQAPIDLSGKTLTFTIDSQAGVQLAAGAVSVQGENHNVLVFTPSATDHAVAGIHRYSVREANGDVWARGDYGILATAGPPDA
jgi:hypothetical protein